MELPLQLAQVDLHHTGDSPKYGRYLFYTLSLPYILMYKSILCIGQFLIYAHEIINFWNEFLKLRIALVPSNYVWI